MNDFSWEAIYALPHRERMLELCRWQIEGARNWRDYPGISAQCLAAAASYRREAGESE